MPISKIDQLDEAANYLMRVADQEKNIVNTCHLTSSEALSLLQVLHAMIDEEIQKKNQFIDSVSLENCQKKCHCGIYADIPSNNSQKEILLHLAQTTSLNNFISCANTTAQWFCDGQLMTLLKSEIDSSPPANGL